MSILARDGGGYVPVMQVDRRDFINLGVAITASCILPKSAVSAGPSSGSLENMHTGVCQKVRELSGAGNKSITVLFPKGSLANLQPVATRFAKETGVDVRYVEAPLDDINSKILLANLIGDTSFDVALPATFGIPDLAQAGAIRNLDAFAAEYEPADFQTSSLYSLGDYYKGSLYGYQTDGDAYVMFYNRDFLENSANQDQFEDKYGRPLAIPKTWHELDETSAFFHRPDQNTYGGSLFRTAGYLPWEWWIRFHSKGFFPFDNDMNPQINNEAGVVALVELIAASGNLDPRTRSDNLFQNWASFSEGRSFCNIGWGGTQKFLNSPNSRMRDRLAFGPTPGGLLEGQLLKTPYFNWGWNYVVSSNSPEAEVAYLFTLYACSPFVSTESIGHADGYFDPFRPSHYQDPQVIDIYSEAFLETHRDSLLNAIPDLYLNGQSEYFGALRENLAAAMTGKLTAREALDRTASQWRLTTFQLGAESQNEQWLFLKSRYPAELRKLLK